MSNSSVISLNTLLNKAADTLNLSSKYLPLLPFGSNQADNYPVKNEFGAKNDIKEDYLSIKEKVLSFHPATYYQQHALHYVLKGLGYLPEPILEGLIGCLKGPTSTQYTHANAHLRLIIAVNGKLKTPLELTPM